jgi:hypothetical protein
VASRKRATPLLFALDRTYRLWQQFARFGLLHPVVLESLPGADGPNLVSLEQQIIGNYRDIILECYQ